jgi:hypothetical protein
MAPAPVQCCESGSNVPGAAIISIARLRSCSAVAAAAPAIQIRKRTDAAGRRKTVASNRKGLRRLWQSARSGRWWILRSRPRGRSISGRRWISGRGSVCRWRPITRSHVRQTPAAPRTGMVTRRTRIWRALGQRESGDKQGDETANPQVHDSPVQLRATPSAIK